MTLMRQWGIGCVIILGGVALGLGVVGGYGDEVLRDRLVNKIASVTDTEVTIGHIETDLLSGNIVIEGMSIGSPEGFSENILSIDTVDVGVDIRTLFDEVIAIEYVTISGLDVRLEQRFPFNVNVIALKQSVSQAERRAGSTPDPMDGRLFGLELLAVRSGLLFIHSAALGNSQTSIAPFSALYTQAPMTGSLKVIIQTIIQEIIKRTAEDNISPPAMTPPVLPAPPIAPLASKRPAPPSKEEIQRKIRERLPQLPSPPPPPPIFRHFP